MGRGPGCRTATDTLNQSRDSDLLSKWGPSPPPSLLQPHKRIPLREKEDNKVLVVVFQGEGSILKVSQVFGERVMWPGPGRVEVVLIAWSHRFPRSRMLPAPRGNITEAGRLPARLSEARRQPFGARAQ